MHTVTGTIDYIGPIEEKSATFKTREIWVVTQEQYSQTLNIQFVNENVNLLNNFRQGEVVTININLRGNKHQSQTGEFKCYNSIQGWKIGHAQPQGYGPNGYQGQGSATEAYHNQQPQGYGQPQGYNNQNNYGQPQGYGQPSNYGNHNPNNKP